MLLILYSMPATLYFNSRLKATGLRGHVKAMVVNGPLELTDMRGTIDAAGVNASVSARMAEVTGPLRLESTNGRITLEIPRTARANLNARSVNGNITVTGAANVEVGVPVGPPFPVTNTSGLPRTVRISPIGSWSQT